MYTFMFYYDEDIDGFGQIDFCTENQSEAEEMFAEWCKENGYVIDDYEIEIVYDPVDAEYYGDEYLVKLEA